MYTLTGHALQPQCIITRMWYKSAAPFKPLAPGNEGMRLEGGVPASGYWSLAAAVLISNPTVFSILLNNTGTTFLYRQSFADQPQSTFR